MFVSAFYENLETCVMNGCFCRGRAVTPEPSTEITTVWGSFLSFSDGDDFGEDPSRKIVSLNFESLLDGKIFRVA